jgi:outer membrane usher protein FimD/PapC
MIRPHRSRLSLLVLAMACAAAPASAAAAGSSIRMTEAPADFADLEQPREMLVDVYFGSRRIGEAWVIARPGLVRFRDPSVVLSLVPNLKAAPALAARLAVEMKDNAGLACPAQGCSALAPEVADVIFDESRLRLDLFLNREFLDVAGAGPAYLPVPDAALSLTSSLGGALAGSTTGPTSYNFQNRTIVGFRNARIRSDSSLASDLGFVLDDLVAEVDTRRHRYSGGLFWAPGVDFTGRRRIAGFGFSTQFDTREDNESIGSTPLILFLGQPSRVEILVDGRLVTSASFEAGNQSIDSSSLPSGSYPLVLRIREQGGNVREERRFFVKNAEIAPPGQPVYFAYAGLLANTRQGRPVSLTKNLYYQVGAARRVNASLALDAAILGTEDKAIAQLGAWFVTDVARVRAAALASLDGDRGLLLQAGSAGFGRLNFNFDLRRVWSSDGRPLIPVPTYADTFRASPLVGAQAASGSYTQAIGSVTYSLGQALVGLTGSYRRDRGTKADYSVGPSLTWPLVSRGGFQLLITADAQRTRSTTAAFAGFRLLYTAGGYSTVGSAGYATIKSRDGGRSASRQVGSLSAQWFHSDEDRTQVGFEAGIHRDVETTTARANAQAHTRLGSARAELLHGIEGRGGTQYGLSFQTGLAVGGRALELGGRDLNQSAIIAALDGTAGNAAFDVLIDGIPRGRIGSGERLPIFLEAYRSYVVRLRAVSGSPVDFDSKERRVTLYPGNVEQVRWKAEPLVTLFGQAVSPEGAPIADAGIAASRGIGQTDANGYFQVDAAADGMLELRYGKNRTCKIPLAGLTLRDDYVRLGRVVCQ